MNAGNLILLLLAVGVLAMLFRRRGGHSHGAAGGCCEGHGHSHDDSRSGNRGEADERLGKPGA